MAKSPYPKSQTLKTLECGHTVHILSFIQAVNGEDPFFCPRCQEMRLIEGVIHQWRYVCGSCSVSRRYGEAKLNAELGAVRHRHKFPGHVVSVMYGPNVKHTFGQNTIPLNFGGYSDEPSF